MFLEITIYKDVITLDVFTQEDLDKEMLEKYNLNNCVNSTIIKESIYVRLIAYALVLTSGYMIKIEMFNYPLSINKTFVFVILSYLLIIPIHEICHYIPFKFLKYEPKLHLFSNTIDGAIKREDLIIISISPLVVISVLLVTLMVILTSYIPLLLMILGIHILTCIADLAQFNLAKNFHKNCYIGVANKTEYRGYL